MTRMSGETMPGNEAFFDTFENDIYVGDATPEMRCTADAVGDYRARMERLAPEPLPQPMQAELAEMMVIGREAGNALTSGDVTEAEVAKLEQAAQRGMEARERLILTNWKLAVSVASTRQGKGLELMDLIQHANQGMMLAADTYKLDQGTRFTTYAYRIMHQRLTKALQTDVRAIRLSMGTEMVLNTINRSRHALRQKLNREATDTELAADLDMPIAKVVKYTRYGRPLLSLDAAALPTEDPAYRDLNETTADPSQDTEAQSLASMLPDDINEVLAELSKEQQEIIELIYGLNGREPMGKLQIAQLYGLNPNTPGAIERKALQVIRNSKKGATLEEYLS